MKITLGILDELFFLFTEFYKISWSKDFNYTIELCYTLKLKFPVEEFKLYWEKYFTTNEHYLLAENISKYVNIIHYLLA